MESVNMHWTPGIWLCSFRNCSPSMNRIEDEDEKEDEDDSKFGSWKACFHQTANPSSCSAGVPAGELAGRPATSDFEWRDAAETRSRDGCATSGEDQARVLVLDSSLIRPLPSKGEVRFSQKISLRLFCAATSARTK